MKVVFSGCGTLGPVTPLLALIEHARRTDGAQAHEFLFLGTERGVELPLLRKYGVNTVSIPSGKLRRYAALRTVSDVWRIGSGMLAARNILKEFAPQVVVTAGGYVSVPVHAAALTLGIPSVVHQQDVQVGLANRLMAHVARRITATIPAHAHFFGSRKTMVTGNPVRPSVLDGSRTRAVELFHLDETRATIFVFGGGTGAQLLNDVVAQMAHECEGLFQIIHLTGMERTRSTCAAPYYHPYPFFTTEMAHAYSAADVVVARAGFNAISEIAAWGKPAILVPISRSHQEKNATFASAHGAALTLDELSLTSAQLLETIRALLTDTARYAEMSAAAKALLPLDGAARVWEQVVAAASVKL